MESSCQTEESPGRFPLIHFHFPRVQMMILTHDDFDPGRHDCEITGVASCGKRTLLTALLSPPIPETVFQEVLGSRSGNVALYPADWSQWIVEGSQYRLAGNVTRVFVDIIISRRDLVDPALAHSDCHRIGIGVLQRSK